MACRQGNLSRVTELLSVVNVDVNARDNFGWTPLHEAIAHGKVEVVKLLLDFAKKDSKQAVDGWEMIKKKTKVSFS